MKEAILGVIRHILTIAGGALASKGVVGSDDVELLIGSVVSIAGVIWSVWAKRTAKPTTPNV